MADLRHSTDGPSPSSPEAYDTSLLPDYDVDFVSDEDIAAFAAALSAPEHVSSPSTDDLAGLESRGSVSGKGGLDVGRAGSLDASAGMGAVRRKGSWLLGGSRSGSRTPSRKRDASNESGAGSGVGVGGGVKRTESLFITAQNDWAPVVSGKDAAPIKGSAREWKASSQDAPATSASGTKLGGGRRSRKKERKKRQQRSRDETREGYLYSILAWPLLGIVGAWIAGLGLSYMLTRWYIWCYEYFVAWRGQRYRLRKKLYACDNYGDWVTEAKKLDDYLGNDVWKEGDEYAYYDHKTVRRVVDQMGKMRRKVERETDGERQTHAVEELRVLVEACVKSNFVGVENSRLYSQTYYGTKNLVQEFVDEGMVSTIRMCKKYELTIANSPEKRNSALYY